MTLAHPGHLFVHFRRSWHIKPRVSSWLRHLETFAQSASAPLVPVVPKPHTTEAASLRVVSLNILAPCYHRLKAKGVGCAPSALKPHTDEDGTIAGVNPAMSQDGVYFESFDEGHYLDRNRKIIDMLDQTDADVILLQEFWLTNDRLTSMYRDRLGAKFALLEIRRSSHWRKREDGLACLVRKNKVLIQDSQDIIFHDCGDRVAKMLLLAVLGDGPHIPPQQLIVVNTHLLFPHNMYSKSIRKRQMTKILGFVDSYQRKRKCYSPCSGTNAKLPVVVAGDFNGSLESSVHCLMREQRYQNAFTEYTGNVDWVSHKTHLQTIMPVDHVMFLNPSDQQESIRGLPDWTNLVYREMYDEIMERYHTATDALREAYIEGDQDKNDALSKDEFETLLKTLGFTGEGRPALTPAEVKALIASADENGDGSIDFKEFLDRFESSDREHNTFDEAREYACFGWLRGEDHQHLFMNTTFGPESRSKEARPCANLVIGNASLYPPELERGEWPEHWKLSDHGMVVVDFLCKAAAV